MSIANRIEQIENHLKDDYQSIANLGADLTNVDKNIENIAELLDGVYDVLPKTSFQEGTSVTIEGGLKGKLDFENDIVGYGDTSQESTTGKNIYPSGTSTQTIGGITFTPQIDGGIKLQGTSTYSNYYVAGGESNYVDVPNLSNLAETVTLSVSGMQEGIQVYVVGQTLGAKGTSVSGSIGFTTTANDKYRLFIRVMANNTVNTTLYIQLEKGSSATSFEKYTNGASPNPSYPQDIEVVRGKNRLDDSSLVLFNSNKYISTSNFSTEGKIEIKPSSTYSLVYKKSTINDFNMWEFDSSNNKTAISSTGSDNGNYRVRLFTTLSTTKTMSFYAGSNDTYTSIEEFLQAKELMLLEGDYSSQAIPSYLPYNTIGVKARGKNLADNSKLVNGYMTAEGIWHYGSGNEYRSTDLIEVKEGKTYTSSLYNKNKERIAYLVWTTYDINKNFIAQYTTTNLVISSGVKYIRARNYQIQTSYIINDDYLYQVEENNTPTNYEPYYTPQIKQLSLGDIELCKIGNYQDYLYKSGDKWYKHEEVGKIILDGSTDEHWFIEAHPAPTEISNRFICDNLPSLDVTTQKDFNYGFCNLGHISSNAQYATDLNAIRLRYINGQNRLDCMFDIESVAILKPLLQNTPMKVYYQKLGGTTDIELTDTTLIEQLENWYNAKSYNGTTIIESNGDLPMIIKVRALKGE